MSRSRRLLWIPPTGLIAVVLLSLWYFRSPEPIEAPGPNPFVKELMFIEAETREPIGDVLEMRVGEGLYAYFAFIPADGLPETYDDLNVERPDWWPLSLAIYPPGSTSRSDVAMKNLCVKFTKPSPPEVPTAQMPWPPPRGMRGYWNKANGFQGELKPLSVSEVPQGAIYGWTFFAMRDPQPGEYVFELAVYPMDGWKSAVSRRIGPEIVLHRGLLHVLPAETPVATQPHHRQ